MSGLIGLAIEVGLIGELVKKNKKLGMHDKPDLDSLGVKK